MDSEPTLKTASNGTKHWRFNGEYHRVDGPAIEYADGTKSWYLNGRLHRVDGPAIEYADGDKGWRLYDTYYSFDDWIEVNKYISEEEKVMLKLIYG
jgi:hypothetical protein